MVSVLRREVRFEELSSLIPKLGSGRHKGQNGKVGVIGGSFEYTGAPFYGASAALHGGGDLSHIFCTEKAATPIKSYSPEIIVHPYLLSESDLKRPATYEETEDCVKSITKWYTALNSVVIGSGLGRDNAVAACLEGLYSNLEEILTVCDGDFFWFLTEKNKGKLCDQVRARSKYTILTPNKVEFKRMWDFLKGGAKRTPEEHIKAEKEEIEKLQSPVVEISIESPLAKDQAEIAKELGNVNMIEKGELDIITDGKKAYVVKKGGSLKRCGGQGDILAGLTGLYSYWDFLRQKDEKIETSDDSFNLLKGCVLASYINKSAGAAAYKKYKYGLTAPEILEELADTINNFIEKGFTE